MKVLEFISMFKFESELKILEHGDFAIFSPGVSPSLFLCLEGDKLLAGKYTTLFLAIVPPVLKLQ